MISPGNVESRENLNQKTLRDVGKIKMTIDAIRVVTRNIPKFFENNPKARVLVFPSSFRRKSFWFKFLYKGIILTNGKLHL